MKRVFSIAMIVGAFIFAITTIATAADVQTLRGVDATTDSVKSEVHSLVETKKWERTFRQQPPLIPHKIEEYEINLKVNQCIRCHDWRNAAKENAPEVAKTHYVDRNGEEWEEVVRGRWFCNQCHVPQTNAKLLVENTFAASTGGRK